MSRIALPWRVVKLVSNEDAQNLRSYGWACGSRFGAVAGFCLRDAAWPAEWMREFHDEDGLRADGDEGDGEAHLHRVESGQELLRDFAIAAARRANLGWEFRRGCPAGFGFRRSYCNASPREYVVS